MTEQEIIDLGFEKTIVPAEESGELTDFYYYSRDIEHICLISNSNDELVNGDWFIEILEGGIRFFNSDDVRQLISLLEKNTMTTEKQIEEILIESHSYGLGTEVMNSAKQLMDEGHGRLNAYELAFHEWIK
jgi:hypothetical protein